MADLKFALASGTAKVPLASLPLALPALLHACSLLGVIANATLLVGIRMPLPQRRS
jgi:hypothetical protein